MPQFATLTQFNDWLNSRGLFHMELGLERMYRSLQALNLLQPPFKIIQVLGTNGKGSTCAFLSQLGIEHRIKTGLYTSPHFVTACERIKINNHQVDEDSWLAAANEVFTSCKDLTYFEFLTVLALLLFKQQKVELAILEAGLGGANDATSAIQPDCHCFTSVAMDHAAVIGPGIKEIAFDKARAIKAPVFTAPQFPVVVEILKKQAAVKNVAINFIQPLSCDYKLSLPGNFQFTNAALALDAWRFLAVKLRVAQDINKEKKALSNTFLPGRMQKVTANAQTPDLLLDGGHNPAAIATLCRELAKSGNNPKFVIFSAFKDKDWRANLGLLMRQMPTATFLIAQMPNDRAADAKQMASYCNVHLPHSAIAFDSLQAALAYAFPLAKELKVTILITGSIYLLGFFFNLYPQYLDQCAC